MPIRKIIIFFKYKKNNNVKVHVISSCTERGRSIELVIVDTCAENSVMDRKKNTEGENLLSD